MGPDVCILCIVYKYVYIPNQVYVYYIFYQMYVYCRPNICALYLLFKHSILVECKKCQASSCDWQHFVQAGQCFENIDLDALELLHNNVEITYRMIEMWYIIFKMSYSKTKFM